MSLDALRGFDMFWILGADALVRAFDRMNQNAVTKFLAGQLSHKDWDGFAFYDLIFPLFVFIAGASSVWSLTKECEQHGRAGACRRVIRRGLLLVVIGIFYSGGFSTEWPNIRLLGVLQRIGLAYMGAGLLFLFFKPRTLAVLCGALLAGYWAMMNFIPVRDIQLDAATLAQRAREAGDPQTAALFKETVNPSAARDRAAWEAAQHLFAAESNATSGRFEPGLNLANHLDFQFLPGRKYDHYWDPEGILSTLPAIATCLLGVLAGVLLRHPDYDGRRKVALLLGAGAAGVVLGFLWGMQFPVVKKIWTSSFVLVAGGWSAMLLAVFYQVVDVWQHRSWCRPFVWIGMNSITVYLASNIIGFRRLAERFGGGDVKAFLDTHVAKGTGELLLALIGLGLGVLLCWFLQRRKIFLRL
jgi:predicted acyltransferase